jgi:hypothetical protein
LTPQLSQSGNPHQAMPQSLFSVYQGIVFCVLLRHHCSEQDFPTVVHFPSAAALTTLLWQVKEQKKAAKKLKPKDAAKLTGGKNEEKAQTTANGVGILSKTTFAGLDICDETKKGIADLGFANMTEIQAQTITPLLAGRDLLAQVHPIGHRFRGRALPITLFSGICGLVNLRL